MGLLYNYVHKHNPLPEFVAIHMLVSNVLLL